MTAAEAAREVAEYYQLCWRLDYSEDGPPRPYLELAEAFGRFADMMEEAT